MKVSHYPIVPVQYVVGGGKKPWIITEEMTFILSNGDEYVVEEGFRFDGTSSPRFLWSIFPPIDDRIFAVILHDHMYVNDYLRDVMPDREAKDWIDNEMEIWSNEYCPREKMNRAMKIGVDLFGWKIFLRKKEVVSE